jgi:hypothetical protein
VGILLHVGLLRVRRLTLPCTCTITVVTDFACSLQSKSRFSCVRAPSSLCMPGQESTQRSNQTAQQSSQQSFEGVCTAVSARHSRGSGTRDHGRNLPASTAHRTAVPSN